jgi:hypothetical protein
MKQRKYLFNSLKAKKNGVEDAFPSTNPSGLGSVLDSEKKLRDYLFKKYEQKKRN